MLSVEVSNIEVKLIIGIVKSIKRLTDDEVKIITDDAVAKHTLIWFERLCTTSLLCTSYM